MRQQCRVSGCGVIARVAASLCLMAGLIGLLVLGGAAQMVGLSDADARQRLSQVGIHQPGVAVPVRLGRGLGDCSSQLMEVPVSIQLDLTQLGGLHGSALDPYRIKVVSEAPAIVASRFERLGPGRIKVSWMASSDSHEANYLVYLGQQESGPPPRYVESPVLGNGDPLRGFGAQGALSYPYHSSVTVTDWNGDGIRDIIIGSWQDFAHLFINLGSDDNIVLSEHEHYTLTADNGPVAYKVPDHALAGTTVLLADLNQDGLVDILIGGYVGTGGIVYYENKGTRDADGWWEFRNGVRISGTNRLSSPRVAVHDWDGDGINDLLLTSRKYGSSVYWCHIRGWVGGVPIVDPPAVLHTADGAEIRADADMLGAVPHVVDWDGDGYDDLILTGTKEYLLLFRNTGQRAADGTPVLQPGVRAKDGLGRELAITGGEKALAFLEPDSRGRRHVVSSSPLQFHRNALKQGYAFVSSQPINVVSQKTIDLVKLNGLQFVDWYGRGNPDLVTGGPQGLLVYEYVDGKYQEPKRIQVDSVTDDWFGCPDFGEYRSLYPKPLFVDWNGDGLLDLVVVSEHSWRFGYLHLYENLGDWRFGPEKRIVIGGTHDWAAYTDGRVGQGIVVDKELFLDFLSYPTEQNIDPQGGSIDFWYKSTFNYRDKVERYFFASQDNVAVNQGRPLFGALKNTDGSITFTAWNSSVATEPLDWKAGEWHHFEFSWGNEGLAVRLDGRLVASHPTPVKPGRIGRRLHLASKPTPYIQGKREVPTRIGNAPRGADQPIYGVLDEFRIRNRQGDDLLYLPFDGTADGAEGALSATMTDDRGQSGLRMLYGYRSVPAFADLDGDGTIDAIIPTGDGTRGRDTHEDFGSPYDGPDGTFGRGYLVLYRNKSQDKMGPFTEGEILRHTDGAPLRVHYRTQVLATEWYSDGRMDIILASEHLSQRKGQVNAGVDIYRNESTGDALMFASREPMQKLISQFEPWHDVQIAETDWFGDGDKTLAVLSDGGLRLFKRQYLRETPTVYHGEVIDLR